MVHKEPIALVYVAGPLSATTIEERRHNVQVAVEVRYQLLNLGANPYTPHFDELALELIPTSHKYDYEFWMALDFQWIEKCDALYLIDESPGSLREVEHARKYGLPVFRDMNSITGWLSLVAHRRFAYNEWDRWDNEVKNYADRFRNP